jgi:hypothetical protein
MKLLISMIVGFTPVEDAFAIHPLSLSAGDIEEGSGHEGCLCSSQP